MASDADGALESMPRFLGLDSQFPASSHQYVVLSFFVHSVKFTPTRLQLYPD